MHSKLKSLRRGLIVGASLVATAGISAGPAQAAVPNYGTCNTAMVAGPQTQIPAINRGVYGLSPGCQMQAPFSARDGGGNDIAGHLQYSLNRCEGKNLAVDNNYGSGTAAAVKQVQTKYGLTAKDGIYGPKTGAAMLWFVNGTGKCVKGSALGVGF